MSETPDTPAEEVPETLVPADEPPTGNAVDDPDEGDEEGEGEA